MFETKGDLPEWRLIYDHAKTLDVGQTITYEVLDGILGRDFATGRSPIYRAMRELEDENSRTLVNVPNIGYRVAEAIEHEDLAKLHHKKSRRSIRRAASKLHSADRTRLTREQARRFDDMQAQLDQQAHMLRRVDGRVTKVDNRVTKVETDVQARLDRLTDILTRHGIPVDGEPTSVG